MQAAGNQNQGGNNADPAQIRNRAKAAFIRAQNTRNGASIRSMAQGRLRNTASVFAFIKMHLGVICRIAWCMPPRASSQVREKSYVQYGQMGLFALGRCIRSIISLNATVPPAVPMRINLQGIHGATFSGADSALLASFVQYILHRRQRNSQGGGQGGNAQQVADSVKNKEDFLNACGIAVVQGAWPMIAYDATAKNAANEFLAVKAVRQERMARIALETPIDANGLALLFRGYKHCPPEVVQAIEAEFQSAGDGGEDMAAATYGLTFTDRLAIGWLCWFVFNDGNVARAEGRSNSILENPGAQVTYGRLFRLLDTNLQSQEAKMIWHALNKGGTQRRTIEMLPLNESTNSMINSILYLFGQTIPGMCPPGDAALLYLFDVFKLDQNCGHVYSQQLAIDLHEAKTLTFAEQIAKFALSGYNNDFQTHLAKDDFWSTFSGDKQSLQGRNLFFYNTFLQTFTSDQDFNASMLLNGMSQGEGADNVQDLLNMMATCATASPKGPSLCIHATPQKMLAGGAYTAVSTTSTVTAKAFTGASAGAVQRPQNMPTNGWCYHPLTQGGQAIRANAGLSFATAVSRIIPVDNGGTAEHWAVSEQYGLPGQNVITVMNFYRQPSYQSTPDITKMEKPGAIDFTHGMPPWVTVVNQQLAYNAGHFQSVNAAPTVTVNGTAVAVGLTTVMKANITKKLKMQGMSDANILTHIASVEAQLKSKVDKGTTAAPAPAQTSTATIVQAAGPSPGMSGTLASVSVPQTSLATQYGLSTQGATGTTVSPYPGFQQGTGLLPYGNVVGANPTGINPGMFPEDTFVGVSQKRGRTDTEGFFIPRGYTREGTTLENDKTGLKYYLTEDRKFWSRSDARPLPAVEGEIYKHFSTFMGSSGYKIFPKSEPNKAYYIYQENQFE